jgi:hypothetical protein
MHLTIAPAKQKKSITIHEPNEMHHANNRIPISLHGKPTADRAVNIFLGQLRLSKIIIENVYQEKYTNGNATGLGDFIRGSFFLMQFCDNYGISYNINLLNHPVSRFLKTYEDKQPLFYENVNKFTPTNVFRSINKEFAKYLSKQPTKRNTLCVCSIHYPLSGVSQKQKMYMQQILTPTDKMVSAIDYQLSYLKLVKQGFTVIHIRYGDKFLVGNINEIDKSHLEIMQNALDNLDPTQQYLLISDNINIKKIMTQQYAFIKTIFNEITHTGEGVLIDTVKLQNTMIDFYLFSYAVKVIAFSVYPHGSGFSQWATETYSIPYSCKYLN